MQIGSPEHDQWMERENDRHLEAIAEGENGSKNDVSSPPSFEEES